jgi:hypothetical protein
MVYYEMLGSQTWGGFFGMIGFGLDSDFKNCCFDIRCPYLLKFWKLDLFPGEQDTVEAYSVGPLSTANLKP